MIKIFIKMVMIIIMPITMVMMIEIKILKMIVKF